MREFLLFYASNKKTGLAIARTKPSAGTSLGVYPFWHENKRIFSRTSKDGMRNILEEENVVIPYLFSGVQPQKSAHFEYWPKV